MSISIYSQLRREQENPDDFPSEDLYDRMIMPVPYGPAQRGHIYGIALSFGLIPERVTKIHIECGIATITVAHKSGGLLEHHIPIEDAQS